jgi:dTDP-L-rhamnose 4-epimerase
VQGRTSLLEQRVGLGVDFSDAVYEDGRETRDFAPVSDVVATNLAALDLQMVPGQSEAVNVCSGRPATIAEVATALSKAFGPNGARPVITGAWRAGDVRHVVASPAKVEHIFGFKAKVDFAAGLAELATETDAVS